MISRISATHQEAIHSLVTAYKDLPLWKWIFFPGRMAKAINALPVSPDDYTPQHIKPLVLAFLNTFSIFTWFFNCLHRFKTTRLIQAAPQYHTNGSIEETAFERFVTFDRFSEEFFKAATAGNTAKLESLYMESPTVFQTLLESGHYAAFCTAAENGHLDVLKYLEEKAPAKLQDMIAADDYWAFRKAAETGHLDVLKYLEEKAPAKLQAMIAAGNYGAFRNAAAYNQQPVVHFLLSFPSVFAHAEAHINEYRHYTAPYIMEQLSSLRRQREAAEASDARVVFDLRDADEIKRCFYIIRHLIRCNDPAVLDDIRFLLDIPAVKPRKSS